MSRKSLAPGALALALFAATPSWAASDADLAQIRDEIQVAQQQLEITAAVEAVADGLPGGGGDRSGAAEHAERGV